MAKWIIPTPLRKFTNNDKAIETGGSDISQAIGDLTRKYPELKGHLLDNEGNIRKFVKIYLGDEDIKTLENEKTRVEKDSVISIIPAIAGGKSFSKNSK